MRIKRGKRTAMSIEALYGKYRIAKADGSLVDPHADYFILRLDTDPVAWSAAREYARMTPNRKLSNDLLERVAKYDPCDSIREPEALRYWQITKEKKRALSIILEYISYDANDDIEICFHAAVLRTMLEEAL